MNWKPPKPLTMCHVLRVVWHGAMINQVVSGYSARAVAIGSTMNAMDLRRNMQKETLLVFTAKTVKLNEIQQIVLPAS